MSVLGLLHAKAHPETVAALICVAPVVSFSEQQRRAYAFDLAEAKRRGETGTLEELRKLGEPPYGTVAKANALERITTRYGGVDFESRNRTAIVVHGVLLGLATPWQNGRNVDQFGRPDARGLAKRRPAPHCVANAQNGEVSVRSLGRDEPRTRRLSATL
jgi:hypothetical protein